MSDKCNCDSSVTSVTSVTECAKCRYLQASGTQVGNHSWDTRVTPAQCLRSPPVIVDGGSVRPEVSAHSFCGEWKPRPEDRPNPHYVDPNDWGA